MRNLQMHGFFMKLQLRPQRREVGDNMDVSELFGDS